MIYYICIYYIYIYVCVCVCVILGSYPTRPTFCSYFKEYFSGEQHMYQFVPLHSCDYVKKISIKLNLSTEKGNSLNEI